MNSAVCHLVLAIALLVTYLVLTLTGNDGNPVLAVLGGQGLGASASSMGRRSP